MLSELEFLGFRKYRTRGGGGGITTLPSITFDITAAIALTLSSNLACIKLHIFAK